MDVFLGFWEQNARHIEVCKQAIQLQQQKYTQALFVRPADRKPAAVISETTKAATRLFRRRASPLVLQHDGVESGGPCRAFLHGPQEKSGGQREEKNC